MAGWTQVAASGLNESKEISWCRDTTRNTLFVLKRSGKSNLSDGQIYHWNGTTLTPVSAPTFSANEYYNCIDYDPTGDNIVVSGGHDGGFSDAWYGYDGASAFPGSVIWNTVNTNIDRAGIFGIHRHNSGEAYTLWSNNQGGSASAIYTLSSLGDTSATGGVTITAGNSSTIQNAAQSIRVNGTTPYVAVFHGIDISGTSTRLMIAAVASNKSVTTYNTSHTNSNITPSEPGVELCQPIAFDDHDASLITMTDGTNSAIYYVTSAGVVRRHDLLGEATCGAARMDDTVFVATRARKLYRADLPITGDNQFIDASLPVPIGATELRGLSTNHSNNGLLAWAVDGRVLQTVSQVGVPQLLAHGG